MENDLYVNLITIADFFTDPAQDAALLRQAGIANEKNLLPIIVRIGRAQSLTVTALAASIDRDHSATSRQVQRFEALGYLQRTPDPQDRRVQQVSLAPLGRKLYAQIVTVREQTMHAILAELPADKRTVLVAGVAAAADVLQQVRAKRAQADA